MSDREVAGFRQFSFEIHSLVYLKKQQSINKPKGKTNKQSDFVGKQWREVAEKWGNIRREKKVGPRLGKSR